MKHLLLAVALAVGSMALAPLASAQQPQAAALSIEQTEQRITLETATDLLAYGRAKGDALAILAAVRMMTTVQTQILGADGQPIDLGAVLDEAAGLAGDDANLLAMIDELRPAAEAQYRGGCIWAWQCYWNGWCEYAWLCY
ncbi:MAG: hypothetical protein KJZ85_07800 [Rhodobacteraceae bacterium]|jgi:hypothetical protein|nr:hypothetical protein [Paracoccaceae bacterium]